MNEREELFDAAQFADIEGLFEDKRGTGGTYLSVFQHQICERSKAFDTEEEALSNLTALLVNEKGWTGPHKTTNPKTKQDRYSCSKPYDRFVGRIADISKHTKEFDASKGGGKVTNWNIDVLSGGRRLTLQLVWIDHVLKRFLKVAPNIDFRLPIYISAFRSMKNGEAKQAVSFKQYQGDLNNREALMDVENWEKIPEYWQPATDGSGVKIEGSPYTGKDGTVLPPPIHDDEDDTWDYSAQNKFLAIYFRDNLLPTVKKLAEYYGINNEDTTAQAGGELTHTGGGPQANDTPVTVKPFNCVAATTAEFATGAHGARIKQLSQALGMDPDFATQKVVQAGLTEINDEAARYVIYMLETRLAKVGPVAPPVPVAPPPPVAQTQAEPEDLWADLAETAPVVQQSGASEFRQAVESRNAAPVDPSDIDWA